MALSGGGRTVNFHSKAQMQLETRMHKVSVLCLQWHIQNHREFAVLAFGLSEPHFSCRNLKNIQAQIWSLVPSSPKRDEGQGGNILMVLEGTRRGEELPARISCHVTGTCCGLGALILGLERAGSCPRHIASPNPFLSFLP